MDPIIETLLQSALADAQAQVSNFDAQIARLNSDIALVQATRASAIEKRDAILDVLK